MLAGDVDIDRIERDAQRELSGAGWKVDYLSVRRRRDLHKPTADGCRRRRAPGRARGGEARYTRLIDNLEI